MIGLNDATSSISVSVYTAAAKAAAPSGELTKPTTTLLFTFAAYAGGGT